MSKVGRKPIDVGPVQVEVAGSEVRYKGKVAQGVYKMPADLKAEFKDKRLTLMMADGTSASELSKDQKMLLGLHRARLANVLQGADKKFEKELRIVGLGFKAALAGNKLQFSLGYSHKIDFVLPGEVNAEVDKTGQILMMRSADKEQLGLVCSQIRDLRSPEPYKGTGIQYATEVVRRKVGKAK